MQNTESERALNALIRTNFDQWLELGGGADHDLSGSGVVDEAFDLVNLQMGSGEVIYGMPFGKYNDTVGSIALRRRIGQLLQCKEDEVLITYGATEALGLYFLTGLQRRRKVVVVTPTFHTLVDIPTFLGFEVLRVGMDVCCPSGLDLEQIERYVGSDTLCIVVTIPNNPTGFALGEHDVLGLIDIASKQGCDILVDETYRFIDWEGKCRRALDMLASYELTLGAGSLCKTYGAPGLRIGWLRGRRDVISAAHETKNLFTFSVPPVLDAMALHILSKHENIISLWKDKVIENFEIFSEWAYRSASCETMTTPDGGVTVFPKLAPMDGRIAEHLLLAERILVTPGRFFDHPMHVRINLAVPGEQLIRCLESIDIVHRSGP
ncbi:pyridoxal phosphate-dependent aminotransferase [Mesorhizobium sp. M1A.T.Ca.IN.004.03.1.1]|uniref:pyridoxal phosphate-dependent aminotransferase n=1 Tax=Mesorhizobium sp. M1A.T.Ca.IN.004.03.1.1 TaxID=2496795 RepID=UPI000FCBC91C|nr:pyridoxal phosphate-dependent aminotransferase [Mesorhizobium sp. M1A.T.Ca.IN.004.03.1.1]RUV41267.1 pyridoxal phosphate-dependent aminotransferase [Mesorhizobium sp. M1A.T.Ca.IN.004.03.1.1]